MGWGSQGSLSVDLKQAQLEGRALGRAAEKGVGFSPGCPHGTRSAGSYWWCGFPGPAEAEAAVTEGVGGPGFFSGWNWGESWPQVPTAQLAV